MDCVAGCENLLMSLMERGDFLPLVAIVMGCTVGMVAIVFGGITSTIKSRGREQTKRELAAYVAEGSISADQAQALIQADAPKECEM